MNQPRMQHPARRRPRGFTLVELLVVLGIIVLLLAAAVPTFNYITGARSTDAAENITSAMLVRARSLAVQNERLTGVAFFVNPSNGRASLAIVTSTTEDSDQGSYIGWTTSSYQSTSPAPAGPAASPFYAATEVATATVLDPKSGKLITGTYINTDTNGTQASGSNAPLQPSAPWAATGNGTVQYLDLAADSDFEALPAGIALQLINDPEGISPASPSPLTGYRDRYIQTGVILFDAQGRLVSLPYAFNNPAPVTNTGRSALTRLLNIDPSAFPQWPLTPTGSTPPPAFHSQLGVVFYDRSTFLNQPGHTEQDYSGYVVGITSFGANPTQASETTEESWLDQNTTPLLVNRYNGTLMKGQ